MTRYLPQGAVSLDSLGYEAVRESGVTLTIRDYNIITRAPSVVPSVRPWVHREGQRVCFPLIGSKADMPLARC